MEAPSSPTSQHRVGNQPSPPHLSPSTGALLGAGAASDVDTDLSRVRDALRTLRTSGYYYEGLSWEEAGRLLRGQPVGTFLVRDSSDNRFLFALSVQTERGPTSVRIHYWRGQFRLDCEDALAASMPWFSCVVSLVEHYVRLSRSAKGQMCVWLDGHGRRDLPIVLTRPLYRQPASLQHLCRIALNRSAASVAAATSSTSCRTVEPLPAALKDYLRDYPHLH
nr:suppressor of cytokine signaling 2-like [Rhipicephalus microplus]